MPDQRIERSTQSVSSLADFLRGIVLAPSPWVSDNDLISALQSQGRLAKYNHDDPMIVASSLNTIKRVAETALPGGFAALDRLRISALEAIENERKRASQSNKRSKRGLEMRVAELEQELHQALQDTERVTNAFQKSLRQGRNYAKQTNKESVIATCRREQRDLCDELSLMHAVPNNVVAIERA